MKKLVLFIFLSIVVKSCTKDDIRVETSQGKISLMNSDGEMVPLQGIEVFIRTSQCKSDNWLSPGICEFVEDLEERAFSDELGNYSITYEVKAGRSFSPKIVMPENYRIIRSGGRSSTASEEIFYYDFLLEAIN